MRVAVYYHNRDIRIEERPLPKIGPGELLLKVMASGICGTDVMEWYRVKKAPRILGHEIAGEITQSRTKKFKKGQRVFVGHHVPCNVCKYCRAGDHTACDVLHAGNYEPGGYSEYVRVPAVNAQRGTYVLPKNVSYEEGTMIEPLACVVRGQRISGVRRGHKVLILGCGVSGLLNVQLAALTGAQVTAVDIDAYRLRRAKEAGAHKIINARAGGNAGGKAERVIICTGAYAAVEQAFRCADKKGIILFFAVPDKEIIVPTVDFWRNELTLASSYGAAPQDLEEALALIKRGKIGVKKMITHVLPLEDIQKGFGLAQRAGKSLKIVLKPH